MSDLARRLVVGIAGARLDPAEAAWLRTHRPAGVILFGRNCRARDEFAELCTQLRACLPASAQLMADHEGGPISVLAPAAGRPPAAWTLGHLNDPDITYRVHHETGRRLREAGIDRVLAPCCDVLVEPRNPVIGSRAFGREIQTVVIHVAAATAGLREGGVAVCLKHWPGHGGTAGDSHDTAVAAGDGALEPPFAAGLREGADALMVGHIAAGPGEPPLTLAPDHLASLRDLFGNRIQLFADDVTMGGLRDALASRGVPSPDGRAGGLVDPADLTAPWLETLAAAGCDLLLVRGIPWRALPLASGESGPPLPAVAPLAGTPLPVPLYADVRERAAWGVSLVDRGESLLWLDATAGDRWGEAAGLAPWLREHFRTVTRIQPAGIPPTGLRVRRLLVTSHRPLPAGATDTLAGVTLAKGEAVVAGHPSLGADLEAVLGTGWRVSTLFDCHGDDLAPCGRNAASRI